MQRKNFAFRYEWLQAIADLDPEIRLEIYEGTIQYAATGKVCFRSGIAATAFNKYILPDFERREKAAIYRARRKAAKAAKESDGKNEKTEPITPKNPTSSKTPTTPKTPTTSNNPTPPPPLLNRSERRALEAEARRLRKRRQRRALAQAD